MIDLRRATLASGHEEPPRSSRCDLVSTSVATAQTALVVAEVSLGVSAAGVVLSYFMWHRSGGRLRVKLSYEEHGHDRFQDVVRVEVHNVGRQAAVLRSVQLGRRVQVPATPHTPIFRTTYEIDLLPNPQEQTRMIAPTDFVAFDTPVSTIVNFWGPGLTLSLQACAKRGDQKVSESTVIQIRTPRSD